MQVTITSPTATNPPQVVVVGTDTVHVLTLDDSIHLALNHATTVLKAEREKVVAIDHHLSRDDLGPVVYADTKAAACVEILWEVAKHAGIEIHEQLALALMAGLVSDTGWFRFDSVTARTHQMAADLTPLVNNAQLYERLMQTETKPKMLLMQRALDNLRWAFDDRFACMSLKQSAFAETGAVPSQTEYLVDMPLTVQTVSPSTTGESEYGGCPSSGSVIRALIHPARSPSTTLA